MKADNGFLMTQKQVTLKDVGCVRYWKASSATSLCQLIVLIRLYSYSHLVIVQHLRYSENRTIS